MFRCFVEEFLGIDVALDQFPLFFRSGVLGFTGFYWVLLGFTGFYWVIIRVKFGFIELKQVAPVFMRLAADLGGALQRALVRRSTRPSLIVFPSQRHRATRHPPSNQPNRLSRALLDPQK